LSCSELGSLVGAEAGVGSGAKTRIEKRWQPSRRRIVKMGRVNRKPFRCGICQVAGASLSGFFLLLLAACLVAMNTSILSIHSCHIYVPNKISFVSAVWASLSAYAQRRGMGAVIEELASLVRSHALGMAPFPQLKPHMQGKHLLMIGGAKTPIAYKRAKQLGLRMTLVDDESMRDYARGRADRFVGIKGFGNVSIRDPQAVYEQVLDATTRCGVDEGKCKVGKYDGVFTLVEDHGPLVSFIGEKLGLVSSPLLASMTARSKYAVRRAMDGAGMKVPRYAVIESRSSLEAAGEKVGFPAFIKPVYGVQATFAAKVNNMGELEATYERFQKEIDATHHPIYHYGSDMILEQLLSGPEIQLEIMLQRGKPVYHCFSSQYSPSRDSLHFPSKLTPDEKEALLDASTRMLQAVGLTDGVVHLELFMDPVMGAQVIEVNNRLSRGFLPQDFSHQLAFGEQSADYYASVFALALGETPAFVHRGGPPLHMAIFLDKPSVEWWKTDPKDAPNRGWEAEGMCGVFVGSTPEEAFQSGQEFQRHGYREYIKSVVVPQDALMLLGLLGAAVASARIFFVGIW
jgi:biotin carboxylase